VPPVVGFQPGAASARARRWRKASKWPAPPIVRPRLRQRRGDAIGGSSAAMCGGSSSNRRARAHPRPVMAPGAQAPGGRRNRKGATAVVTRCGYRRGDSSRGVKRVAGKAARSPVYGPGLGSPARNATNPRIGSGMQQARDFRKRRTVEVVRNHEGGSNPGPGGRRGPRWRQRPRGGPSGPARFRQHVDGGGSPTKSHERRPSALHLPVRGSTPARAGWRLRSGGEGHGGAHDRVTGRAGISGVPRRPRHRGGGDRRKPVAASPGGRTATEARGKGQRPAPEAPVGIMWADPFGFCSLPVSHRA
jgi:hypothetical protein